jgi:predicted O-methyltransferase YrrM
LILLDGAKGLYLDVLKLLEPYLRTGGIIASDNTDHDRIAAYLEYLRTPSKRYTSSGILTTEGEMNRGHKITIRN